MARSTLAILRAAAAGVTAPRSGLPGRLLPLTLEFARFGVVAVCAWLLTDVVFKVLYPQTGAGPQIADATALALATVVSFTANRYWTFRHRVRTTIGREGLLYLLLTIAGLVIQDGGVQLAVEMGPQSGPPYGPAMITALVLAALFRYWSCRTWVWRGTWSHLGHTGQVISQ